MTQPQAEGHTAVRCSAWLGVRRAVMREPAKPPCGLADDARKAVTPKLMTATVMLELSHDCRSQRKTQDELSRDDLGDA